MHKLLPRVIAAVLTFQVGLFAYKLRPRFAKPTPEAVSSPTTAIPTPRKALPTCEVLDDFVDDDRVSYRNYKILKRYKTVRIDYAREDGSPLWADVSFAELRHGSTTIASFDGVYHPTGNSTEFGLFKLLGRDKSQLVVQQITWRAGRHWILDLSDRKARPIYDSAEWGMGREDLCVVDVDNDGILEVSKVVTDFYDLQDKFATSWIPLTPIVFKYNQQTRRYEPANSQFLEYSLGDVPAEDETVSSDDSYEQALIIRRLLEYVFAGQRDKGWAFFERNYRGNDKNEMKRSVQSILKHQPVYRFIYES